MPAETGFPRADVADEFLRVRRRQALARLVQRLRRSPDDVNVILPFDEVVNALGLRGERRIGEEQRVGDQKTDRADQMERLVDAAVVIITVVVPPLHAQSFEKTRHSVPFPH